MHFADKALVAEITARMLLEVKAVLFFEAKPFIFTSGWASPVYIDCRRLIDQPRLRKAVTQLAVAATSNAFGQGAFDAIVGAETAGMPFA